MPFRRIKSLGCVFIRHLWALARLPMATRFAPPIPAPYRVRLRDDPPARHLVIHPPVAMKRLLRIIPTRHRLRRKPREAHRPRALVVGFVAGELVETVAADLELGCLVAGASAHRAALARLENVAADLAVGAERRDLALNPHAFEGQNPLFV